MTNFGRTQEMKYDKIADQVNKELKKNKNHIFSALSGSEKTNCQKMKKHHTV
jgi:hypothetical protein